MRARKYRKLGLRRDTNGSWHISQKGYPRYHTGQYRNRYVHRVRMEQHLGRRLLPSEDVHHRNRNKQDFRLHNLQVIDHQAHGWVTAQQQWYVTNIVEPKRKKEWDSYFAEEQAAVSFP